jgi:tetratricopeptide (TPR) repeat protein
MLNSDSLSVHFAAGFLDEATGDYEKALRQYLRAADLEPASTRALVRIARMHDKLGMPDKAVASYQAAINLDPNFYKPYEHLGDFYFSHGKYSEAAEQFKHVIERSPEAYLAYTNLGAALQEIHQNSEAEQVLAKGLKIRETADGLNIIGTLLASEGRDREAISYYARSVALDSHDYSVFMNFADSNRRLGNFALAKSQYKKGQDLTLAELRENPRNGLTRAALAYFSVRLGEHARAQDEIKQALRFAQNDANVILLAVTTYEAAGSRDSALAALSGATPQFLRTLDREPDLAEFLQDPRFKDVVALANQGEPK